MERLQRALAAAGIASRRKAEDLIREGRVRVDGQVVTELGTRVDPMTQKIEVDGNLIPQERRRYILLHKPSGYITTTDDERGRYTVMDLVQVNERVVPVGRLDRPTEGLLLLTNDGEVAYRVTHPRFGVEKEYEALLDGHPPARALERVRNGIVIDGERTVPEMVRPLRNTDDGTLVRIVIHEGRNRIVRRMFEEIGFPVLKLVRTRIGPLQLGAIPRGQFRDLSDGELEQLREALHLDDEDTRDEQRERRPHWSERRPQPQGMGTRGQRPARDDRGGGMDRHGERRMMPRRDDRSGPGDRQWRPAAGGPRRDGPQGGGERDFRSPRPGYQRGPYTPERRDDRRGPGGGAGGPQRGPARPGGFGNQDRGEQRWRPDGDRPQRRDDRGFDRGPRDQGRDGRDGQNRNVRQWSGPSDQRPFSGPPSDQRGRHVSYNQNRDQGPGRGPGQGPRQDRPGGFRDDRGDRGDRGPRRDGPNQGQFGGPRGGQFGGPRRDGGGGGGGSFGGPRRDGDAPRGPRPDFARGNDRERSFDRGFDRDRGDNRGPRPFQGGPSRDGDGGPGGGGERREWRPRDDRQGAGGPRQGGPGGWQRNDAPRGPRPGGAGGPGGERRDFGPRGNNFRDDRRGPGPNQGQGQGQGQGQNQGPRQWQDRDPRQAEGRWNNNPARRPLGQRRDDDRGPNRGPAQGQGQQWRPQGDNRDGGQGQRGPQSQRFPQPERNQQPGEPRNAGEPGRSLRRQGGGDGGRQWKVGGGPRGPRRTERTDNDSAAE